MDLKDFIRHGGRGAITLRWAAGRAPSAKGAAPRLDLLRGRLKANLDRADLANADVVLSVVGDAFDPPLSKADMAELSSDKAEALNVWDVQVAALAAAWAAQPDRFEAARLQMEDELLRAFAALANERRQAHLGIARYVWRSRDDERVRHAHAAHDDQVFDWEEPPEGGHPGMAWGCRCWAQPLVEPAARYVPLTERELSRLILDARIAGQARAERDALMGVQDSVLALPGVLADTSRFVDLWGRERNGSLSDREADELHSMRHAATARVDGVLGLLSDPLGLLRDAVAEQRRLSELAGATAVAYLDGRATEAMVVAAYEDDGYAERSFRLGVAASVVALRLPSRRVADLDLLDPEALRRFWRDESGAIGPRPIGSAWAVRPNEGIAWGGPIRLQGEPWEDMLERDSALGQRLDRTFPLIDFFDRGSGLVTSAKTLSTRSRSYVDEPTRIFGRLRGYVDRLARFEGGTRVDDEVAAGEIVTRRLTLAIPASTAPDQRFHIQRAIDYARSVGVDLTVMRIR